MFSGMTIEVTNQTLASNSKQALPRRRQARRPAVVVETDGSSHRPIKASILVALLRAWFDILSVYFVLYTNATYFVGVACLARIFLLQIGAEMGLKIRGGAKNKQKVCTVEMVVVGESRRQFRCEQTRRRR